MNATPSRMYARRKPALTHWRLAIHAGAFDYSIQVEYADLSTGCRCALFPLQAGACLSLTLRPITDAKRKEVFLYLDQFGSFQMVYTLL